MKAKRCLVPVNSILVALVFFGGCAYEAVNKDHPALTAAKDSSAEVYFIRTSARFSGATSRPAEIYLDGVTMASLEKGTYVLVHMKPGEKAITIRSFTHYGNEKRVIPVEEKKLMRFDAGHTYYVVLEPYYRGYRWGTSYRPTIVDHAVALRKANDLTPFGMAKNKPLRIE